MTYIRVGGLAVGVIGAIAIVLAALLYFARSLFSIVTVAARVGAISA